MTQTQFVPTHRLLEDIPQLRLTAGMLMRQINPFGYDILHMLDENDWNRRSQNAWLLHASQFEPLPDWPTIRQEMIERIMRR